MGGGRKVHVDKMICLYLFCSLKQQVMEEVSQGFTGGELEEVCKHIVFVKSYFSLCLRRF